MTHMTKVSERKAMLEGFRDLALLISEGPAVLYHAMGLPKIR